MTHRLWGVVVLVGVVVGYVPSVSAGDVPVQNGTAVPYQPVAGQTYAPRPVAVNSPTPQQMNQRVFGRGAQTSFVAPQVQGQRPPLTGGRPEPLAGPPRFVAPTNVPPTNGVAPLPPPGSTNVGRAAGNPTLPGQPDSVDGTIRDDGEYVTITIDGKEMKLRKPQTAPLLNVPGFSAVAEGTVRGRLMQGNHPLVNCRVVIVPLDEDRKGYRYDSHREPHATATDGDGVYFFEHVPVGLYKLTWLPDGTNQWIRRIAIKPDVIVRHSGEMVSLKTIGAAQRTIN